MSSDVINTDDGFVSLLVRRRREDPERVFAIYRDTAVTFRQVDETSTRLARWLRDQGVQSGDRVLLMMRNSPLAIALLFAIGKAGAVWVPVNVQARGDNLRYIVEHCGPTVVVVDHDVAETLREDVPSLESSRFRFVGGPLGPQSLEVGLSEDEPLVAFDDPLPEANAPFAIMYTSGTTGRPKGVIVSHRMLRLSGEGIALLSAIEDGGVFHMWEPLYHIGGAQMIVLPLIRRVHLAMVDRFSASNFWQEIDASGATHIHYLGGLLQILLKQSPSPLDRTHGARIAFGGGCPRDIWRAFEDRFGVQIRECYGMTECSSATTYNDSGVLGSVGKPLPWFDVELQDQTGKPVKQGERGEIVVREKISGAITQGYFNNPEATARAVQSDGFHTGDIGSEDSDGNFYFHGRMTDNVRVKGENVSAFEVEHVAVQHEDIEDCAMIGVPSDIGEQDIKLFVKPKSGEPVKPAELSAWLAQRLAPYQNPRYIVVIDEFERTPSQRIMKHRLASRLETAWDRLKPA